MFHNIKMFQTIFAIFMVFVAIILIIRFRQKENFDYGQMDIPGELADDVEPPESVVDRILSEVVNVVKREQGAEIVPINTIFVKSFSPNKIKNEALKGDFSEHLHGSKDGKYTKELIRIYDEIDRILTDDVRMKKWNFRTELVSEVHKQVDNFNVNLAGVLGRFSAGEIKNFEIGREELKTRILIAEYPYQVTRALREFVNLCKSIADNRRAQQHIKERKKLLTQIIAKTEKMSTFVVDLMKKLDVAILSSTSVNLIVRMHNDNEKNGYPTSVLEGDRRINQYMGEIENHLEPDKLIEFKNLKKSLDLDLDFHGGIRQIGETFNVKQTEASKIYIIRTIFYEKNRSRALQIDSFSFANSFVATIKGLTTNNYDDDVGDQVVDRSYSSENYATKDEIDRSVKMTKSMYEKMK